MSTAPNRNLPPVPGLHDLVPPHEVPDIPPDRIAVVRARMVERITQIMDDSGGSDEARVVLFSQEITLATAWVAMMEEHRDAAAARLRDRGMPMTRIARLARVSDSYLARRLFRRGATRKVIRGGLLGLTVGATSAVLAATVAALTGAPDAAITALGLTS